MENLERNWGLYKVVMKDKKGEILPFHFYCKNLRKAMKECFLEGEYELVTITCLHYDEINDISKDRDSLQTLFRVKYVPTNTEMEEWILADNYMKVLDYLKNHRNITLIDNYIQGIEIIR